MSNPTLVNNIPITDLLDDILGPVVEKVSISLNVAKCLAQADPDCRYCYIEVEDRTKPLLWRVAAYRADYANQQRKKELANLERQVHVLHSELRASLAKKLSSQTGVAQEMLQDAANTLLKSRNPRVMETFGLDISELLEAEDAVKEFKGKK